MSKTAKKHHYVWAHYLTSWAKPGSKEIWHETSKGNVACDSVTGLSREFGFNKIHKISNRDVSYLNLWPQGDSVSLQKFKKSQIEYFRIASRFIGCHEGYEHHPEYNALKEISDRAEFGVFEYTHTIIENLARPIIDQLKIGNTAILDSRANTISFCNFLAQQLFRTKKVKELCLRNIRNLPLGNASLEEYRELFERNWWIISYQVALNLGSSLSSSAPTDNYVFIRNSSPTDFITSDCPVINIHDSAYDPEAPYKVPDELELYFPISPKTAIIIAPTDRHNLLANSISEGQVRSLNRKMAQSSFLTVYAASKQAIIDAQSNRNSPPKASTPPHQK